MRIVTPTEIEEVAWDGYLQPPGKVVRLTEAPLPRVTLGEPAWWPAEQAMESETGVVWTPPAGDRRYTLVRLACTLHPPREERSSYSEVTLTAYLRPVRGGDRVVAHDLYPQRLAAEQKGTFTVGLGPDLRFSGLVDVSMLQVGAEIEYHQVFPVIQGYGLGESRPYWQFTGHSSHPLLGCQSVYILLAAPADAGGVRLSVELDATWKTRTGGILRVGLAEKVWANVSRTITFEAEDGTPDALPAYRPTIDPANPPIAAIRDLLEAAFTVQTLNRFCWDHQAFRPIRKQFSPGHGLADIVDLVIEYCETSLLWDELLAGVKEANPRQYARFETRPRP
jgi:hypothetical protein